MHARTKERKEERKEGKEGERMTKFLPFFLPFRPFSPSHPLSIVTVFMHSLMEYNLPNTHILGDLQLILYIRLLFDMIVLHLDLNDSIDLAKLARGLCVSERML